MNVVEVSGREDREIWDGGIVNVVLARREARLPGGCRGLFCFRRRD